MRIVSRLRNLWLSLEKVFAITAVQWLVGISIGFLTIVCLLQPDIKYLRWISTQTVQILLLLLFVGIGFLLLRSRLLSFIALGCCAALCLFLKNASNLSLNSIERNSYDSMVSLVHCTMSAIQGGSEDDLLTLLSLDEDIVVFQEYTPQWKETVLPMFDSIYPYKFELLRLDNYGQLIFSKYPIVQQDTLNIQGVPIAHIVLSLSEKDVLHVIGHYNYPPLAESYKSTSRKVFMELSEYIRNSKAPTLYAGTINYEPWSNEMVKFRYNGFMNDSRKGFFPSLYNGRIAFFDYPVDHIFYNQFLDCLRFKKVENKENQRIGIRGEYQLKSNIGDIDSLLINE